MQFNFLVFPAPKIFSIQQIYPNIVLIPQNTATLDGQVVGPKLHITYEQFVRNKKDFKSETLVSSVNEDLQVDCLQKFLSRTEILSRKSYKDKINRCTIQRMDSQIDFRKSLQYKKKAGDSVKLHMNGPIMNPSAQFSHKNTTVPSFQREGGNSFKPKSEMKIVDRFPIRKISPSEYIPCTFHGGISEKIIIFFHANGQDVSSCNNFIKTVNEQTRFNVLTVQYRSYSIYGGTVNPEFLVADGERVINYLLERGVNTSDIILLGRSIGSSIAFPLASKYKVHSLTLVSPFLSLQKIAQHLYGSCGQCAIKETLNNQTISQNTKCPILIIHGMEDTLVPYEHSIALMSQCKSYCRLKLIPKMTHSKFSFKNDFIEHFLNFVIEIQ